MILEELTVNESLPCEGGTQNWWQCNVRFFIYVITGVGKSSMYVCILTRSKIVETAEMAPTLCPIFQLMVNW